MVFHFVLAADAFQDPLSHKEILSIDLISEADISRGALKRVKIQPLSSLLGLLWINTVLHTSVIGTSYSLCVLKVAALRELHGADTFSPLPIRSA